MSWRNKQFYEGNKEKNNWRVKGDNVNTVNLFKNYMKGKIITFSNIDQTGTPVSDSENGFIDSSCYDIRMSPAMNRRRIGSFNSNGDMSLAKDSESPGKFFQVSSKFFASI